MSLGLREILNKHNGILSGTSACPGCPENMAMRMLGMGLGKDMVLVVVAGCSSVIQGNAPYNAYNFPTVNVAFAAGPATAAGLARAYKQRGKNVTVVVWAGDGGSADIGFASLSGAAERNDNILYLTVDNEAYMNSGGQRSGSTPFGAITTTTPEGKKENKKNLPLLMIAHNVPYVATASVGYPHDYIEKLKKAKQVEGFKYIHVLTPDPYGWLFDPSKTAEVAKLAVQTCYWPLFEYYNGKLSISSESLHCLDRRTRRPIRDFLSVQGRFKRLTEDQIKILEQYIDNVWEKLKSMLDNQ
ncbi:pyruvate synthase subunit PorB [Saccharolobus islandicus]|uniref:2-oxoacid oxidoreductase (ferredoxin) n=3 Tax=Saccharolobus islandicus TaxID=43080 RepID=C4KEA7_SACI6|nr:pyruvate synthase subunit PorB [Sulfolobus islandicus]ACP39277.1 thiamine pyrophosphate protein domain protein TPP-binding [Sulfolobus islandicus M.14.25]ACP56459.1 thiamine pyrophosphate protein domain protein TPP-binding [Sulfolobus islandicus M.16.27]ACR43145.1 thiamine pyrophosphate protein domain protein TPP-binding [Sulfolobus islandicus M.16.4]